MERYHYYNQTVSLFITPKSSSGLIDKTKQPMIVQKAGLPDSMCSTELMAVIS